MPETLRHILIAVGLIFIIGLMDSCSTPICKDYQVGTFKYEDKQFDAIIVRTETHHTETSDSLNYKDVYKVIWTDDCFYKLVLESTDNPARMPLSKFDTIHVKIGEVDKHGYAFEALILDQKPIGKLIKIEE
ncbi:MAG: hypothetical protein ACI8XB_001246 [Patiriisocius sp.]|jgi:hypothetical protein